jgi:hypothetical protein
MSQNNVDLAGIFGTITQSLAENQQSLNQADGINQDHGDNMVKTFQTITSALQQKQGSSDSAALRYAANQLSSNTTSGSGQLYAQNLAQAADQIKGRSIDMQGAMGLLQTLIGSGQANPQGGQPAGNDPASLMSGLSGGGTSSQGGQPGGDIMSTLLGGLSGAQPGGAGAQGGFDMQNLLNAGMAFLQGRQSGESSTQALVQAFMAGSGMGNTSHREQSTQLVVNSFLQALSSFGNRP